MSGKQIVKTIQCPFVAAHVMPYERFLNHLEKCQYPDKKSFRKCKFNPYHVIHIAEINNHENSTNAYIQNALIRKNTKKKMTIGEWKTSLPSKKSKSMNHHKFHTPLPWLDRWAQSTPQATTLMNSVWRRCSKEAIKAKKVKVKRVKGKR